jgi:NAD(P)-dependent dehydrogenase (short-subunit alcohol dehydrogenase family)
MLPVNAPRDEHHRAIEQGLPMSFQINVVCNIHLISQFELDDGSGYAISKAAMNSSIGMFHAQYKKQGALCMSICPGVVQTGHFKNCVSFFLSSFYYVSITG